jgi:actin-related protein 10
MTMDTPRAVLKPLVFELGAAYTKIGYVGEPEPRHIIKTELTLKSGKQIDLDAPHTYSADEWKEALFHFLRKLFFHYALANPVDRVVHVCENILTSHLLREALADVLFEKYKVQSVSFLPAQGVACYAAESSSILLVDCGFRESRVVPVYKKIIQTYALQLSSVGSHTVYSYLARMLKSYPSVVVTNAEDNTVTYRYPHDDELTLSNLEDIAVRVCYVKPKASASTKNNQRSPWPHVPKDLKLKATETRVTFEPVVSDDTPVKTGQKESHKGLSEPTKYLTYRMTSGLTFHLRDDVRHSVCELFFTPESCEVRSVAELCLDALLKSNMDIRQRLANNIVFAGGSTQFIGFKSRFISEVFSLLETDSRYEEIKPLKSKVNVLSPVFPASTIQWTGATLLAVQEPKHYTVTRKSYLEKKILPDWTKVQSHEEKQRRLKQDSPVKQSKSKPRISTMDISLKLTPM